MSCEVTKDKKLSDMLLLLMMFVQWMFWVGPFIGAAIAAFYHQFILRAGAAKALGSFRSNPTI